MIPARKKQTSSAHPAHCQARLQTSAEESGNLTKDMSETRKDMLDSAESVRLKLGTQTLGRKEMGREGTTKRRSVRSSPSIFGQILIFMEREIKNGT